MKTNRQILQAMGFDGFITMSELMEQGLKKVPSQKGVYVILREKDSLPQFLEQGTGGFFKEQNPNVSILELRKKWVDDTPVMYIGKAGAQGGKATLQSRLKQYVRFGQGAKVGHWGGRYIWQLADSCDLVVCWRTLKDEEPREVERQMISEFKKAHKGMRPFANLSD